MYTLLKVLVYSNEEDYLLFRYTDQYRTNVFIVEKMFVKLFSMFVS